MTKLCIKCKKNKDLSEFTKNITMKDGYQYYCKDCMKVYSVCRYNKKRLQLIEYQKQYIKRNKEKIRIYQRIKDKQPINKIKRNLRRRIKDLLKNIQDTSSLIGCDGKFLKQYIESKFQSGMSWDNYGFGDNKWHIDHIKPLHSFNLNDPEQLKQANHYTNLQPLWQKDNLSKGKKYNIETV